METWAYLWVSRDTQHWIASRFGFAAIIGAAHTGISKKTNDANHEEKQSKQRPKRLALRMSRRREPIRPMTTRS